MGQSISRRVVPRLNNAFQKYENAATKDALDDMAKRQALAKSGQTGGYSDPNAIHGGFRRENAPALPQEAAQEDFLRRQQPAGSAGGRQEMPDDLLKFLNDNPLEKTVDRDLTSPKVLDSLLVEEQQQQQQQQQQGQGNNKVEGDGGASTTSAAKKRTPRTRTRRTMPLAESMVEDLPDDVSADIVGATGVERTTNFSTADLDGVGGSDADSEEAQLERLLRLADRDLAALLRKQGATLASSDAGGTGTADDVAKQKQSAAETYLADRLSTSNIASAEALLDAEKRNAYTSLMTSALRYSGMPVLLKDEVDADYVGVWTDRVKELERMKLRVVKEEETTLLFEGQAGKTSSSASNNDEATAEASSEGSAGISIDARAPESKSQEPQGDATVAKSTPFTEEKEDDWKRQYMEEQKKIKGKVGSTGPATRKFLEEEAARAAAGEAAAETVSGKKVAKKAD